jgi:hypothetical protein
MHSGRWCPKSRFAKETRIAIANLYWLMTHPHGEGAGETDGWSWTFIRGGGGFDLDALADPELTPGGYDWQDEPGERDPMPGHGGLRLAAGRLVHGAGRPRSQR